jgi:hypothetical protein
VALLEQEKVLREMPLPALDKVSMAMAMKPAFSWFGLFRTWWQPLSGFAAVMFIIATGWLLTHQQLPPGAPEGEYRFVLYQPQVNQAEIIGTFTDWSPVPMQKIGQTGYWTLTLKVPQGEHRYSYLIENDGRIADPSVAAREHDDFGGENSVIIIGGDNDPVS